MGSIAVSARGVHTPLKSLHPHKAIGPNTIPTTFLCDYADEIAPILTPIFQTYLDSKIPGDLKEAALVPIFKKGPSDKLQTSLISVLEHIVHSQIMGHYDTKNILTDKQHGCRSQRSCESQLIITLETLAQSLTKGEQIDTRYRQGFEKVPHH